MYHLQDWDVVFAVQKSVICHNHWQRMLLKNWRFGKEKNCDSTHILVFYWLLNSQDYNNRGCINKPKPFKVERCFEYLLANSISSTSRDFSVLKLNGCLVSSYSSPEKKISKAPLGSFISSKKWSYCPDLESCINASLYQKVSSDTKCVKKDGLQPCDFVTNRAYYLEWQKMLRVNENLGPKSQELFFSSLITGPSNSIC